MSQDPVFDKIGQYEADIKTRKAKAQEVRDLRIKGEAKLEQLQKAEAELLSKIRATGLDPDNLKRYIEDRQRELDRSLLILDAALPDDNGTVHLDKIQPQNAAAILQVEVPSSDVAVPEGLDMPKTETTETDPLDFLFDSMPPPSRK